MLIGTRGTRSLSEPRGERRPGVAGITFEDVTKIYGDDVVAVDKMNLDIPDGEFVVFVGPSGCGKSTALRMVAGLEDITRGKLFIEDEMVNELSPGGRDRGAVGPTDAPS